MHTKTTAAADSRSISEIFHQFDWPHLTRINQVSYCTDKIAVNWDTTGWFVNGKGWHVWVFVGRDADGKETVLFEIRSTFPQASPS